VIGRRVAVAGSTGSIGTQTLDVIRSTPDEYSVAAIGAATNIDALAAQAHEWHPDVVALADSARATELKERLPAGVELRAGEGALASIATEPDLDVVVNGVVGFAGLEVTIAALKSGTRLALANKESLIAGGPVVQAARARSGAELVPVDSEHAAVHQCLRGNPGGRVARIVLTASGGPFRGRSLDELAGVTVPDALAHPTWSMGPKITVDSSTLMNKGLEVIEAHELFGIDYDRIDVVVHPQSIVHSMVEYTDGATIAQLSLPDMRLPIGYALAYPDRLAVPFGALDWSGATRLDFEPPDRDAFPCLELAAAAGRAGGSVPAWLNAANEVAVAAFLDGLIPWLAIADVIKETLDGHNGGVPSSIEEVVDADRAARGVAQDVIERRTRAA
jgi:1-deoxy-D-xylulose-5-phosphate reductoisomerase